MNYLHPTSYRKLLLLSITLLSLVLLITCTEDPGVSVIQGTLQGKVTNEINGSIVGNARVILSGPESRSQTVGRDGTYRFDNLIPGDYTVGVVHPLYITTTYTFTVRSFETSNGDITLEPIAQISISPIEIDFGEVETMISLFINNQGSERIEFNVESTEGWLSADRKSVLIAGKNEEALRITINRDLMNFGLNQAILTLNSPEKFSRKIPVAVWKIDVNRGVLYVEEDFIDFSSKLRSRRVTVENIGRNTLSWRLTTDQEWLSASKVTGALGAGEQEEIDVFADRNSREEGVYEGTIGFYSNGGGTKEVGVSMEVISGGGGPNEIVVPVGLKAYYTFRNGTAADITNNYTTLNINAEIKDSDTSLDGYYIHFSGNETFMKINGNPLLNQNAGVIHATISVWVKTGIGGTLVAVPYKNSNSYNEFVTAFNSNLFIHSITNASGRFCCLTDYGTYPFSGSFFVDDEWHHIALTYRGDTEETILYADGTEIARSRYEFYPWVGTALNANTLKIGSDYRASGSSSGIFDFVGAMDNIRLYNRPLSITEIKEIYETER